MYFFTRKVVRLMSDGAEKYVKNNCRPPSSRSSFIMVNSFWMGLVEPLG